MSENLTCQEVMAYTTEIASAYLANNEVLIDDLPLTLKKIFIAVADLSREANDLRHKPALTPAVAIEDSVQNDYIVCLEDGKRLQMLKRHLNTVYKMSIDQYKERWGLPMDYPAVAPNYAKRRSDIAKTTGLGSTGKRKNLKVA